MQIPWSKNRDTNQGLLKTDSNLRCSFVAFLPDMEFVANVMDEPRVLPGNTDDVDARMSSPLCYNASDSFKKYRHLHGFINNRQVFFGPLQKISCLSKLA